VKRNIALIHIKLDQYDRALDELFQIETIERAIHGESSIHLGKTFKVIGTVYMMVKKQYEAYNYLMKA